MRRFSCISNAVIVDVIDTELKLQGLSVFLEITNDEEHSEKMLEDIKNMFKSYLTSPAEKNVPEPAPECVSKVDNDSKRPVYISKDHIADLLKFCEFVANMCVSDDKVMINTAKLILDKIEKELEKPT